MSSPPRDSSRGSQSFNDWQKQQKWKRFADLQQARDSEGAGSASAYSSFVAERKEDEDDGGWEEFQEHYHGGPGGASVEDIPSSASVDEHISGGNKGFKMLEKMGWKKGDGLGKEKKGRVEPVNAHDNVGNVNLGLGKQVEYSEMSAEATAQRKALEIELQRNEDPERRKERLNQVKRQMESQEAVSQMTREFYCATCNKQYLHSHEFEEHLSSYDHHHRKRFAEMKLAMKAHEKGGKQKKKEKEKDRAQAKQLKALRARAEAMAAAEQRARGVAVGTGGAAVVSKPALPSTHISAPAPSKVADSSPSPRSQSHGPMLSAAPVHRTHTEAPPPLPPHPPNQHTAQQPIPTQPHRYLQLRHSDPLHDAPSVRTHAGQPLPRQAAVPSSHPRDHHHHEPPLPSAPPPPLPPGPPPSFAPSGVSALGNQPVPVPQPGESFSGHAAPARTSVGHTQGGSDSVGRPWTGGTVGGVQSGGEIADGDVAKRKKLTMSFSMSKRGRR